MTGSKTLRRGRAAALAAGLLSAAFASAAQAKWLKAESQHFVVYSRGSEKNLIDYTRRLETFDGMLRLFHGRSPTEASGPRLPIYLVGGEGDIDRTMPGASNIGGYYSAGGHDIYAVAIVDSNWIGDKVLLHEYVHHFMLHYYARGYPAWLVEGYAEYFSEGEFRYDRTLIGMPSAGSLRVLDRQPWLPMERLLSATVWETKERDRDVYYAQAWALTHYMVSDDGRKRQLGDYLRRVGAGEASAAAWAAATGETPAVTQNKVRVYIGRSVTAWVLMHDPKAPKKPVTVSALPASADDLLLYDQGVKTNIDEKQRPAYLERIRKLAAGHPNDRLARLALGRVEVRYGDRAAGEAVLQRLLAENPSDEEVLQALALGKLEAADKEGADRKALYAEASALLGRAFKIDPEDYRTLYGFARSRSADPGYPSENVVNVLSKAVELAPQVFSIRLNAAEAMMAREHYDEAVVVLEPVATSPHGGSMTERARTLLKTIQATSGAAADSGAAARAAAGK